MFVAETNLVPSFMKHHVTRALISLILGGTASPGGAKNTTHPEPSTAPAAVNFKAVITTPAWREKPSWMVVAGADRTINPDLERWYANRAHSHTVEVAGASHAVYVSHPNEVAEVIESAA